MPIWFFRGFPYNEYSIVHRNVHYPLKKRYPTPGYLFFYVKRRNNFVTQNNQINKKAVPLDTTFFIIKILFSAVEFAQFRYLELLHATIMHLQDLVSSLRVLLFSFQLLGTSLLMRDLTFERIIS